MVKWLMRWVVGAGMVALIALPGQNPLPAAQAVQDEFIATLDPVQGFIQRQPDGANPRVLSDWETVTERVLVAEGDRIRTDGAGRAFLTFFEGIETEIGPSTLVVVSTLDLPEEDDASFKITLDVLVGHAISSLDVALETGDRFEIHTPGATAVVRGTRWWTLVTPDGSSAFVTKEGTVQVILHEQPAPAAPPDVTPEPLMGVPVPPVLIEAGFALRAARSGEVIETGTEAIVTVATPPPAPLVPATCGDGLCDPGESDVCRVDCPFRFPLPACGDGVCSADQGEDLVLCPADCGPFAGEQCGNGTCDPDESGLTCPADCAPDRYFEPVDPALCGNGTCDPTESALSCPSDCAADQCAVSGDNLNLRAGPSTVFPVVGVLNAGETLPVIGQSLDSTWYVVDYLGIQAWVAGWLATASGPCEGLAVIAAPPEPAGPVPTPAPAATLGVWGGCGSCTYCGPYPASECVLSPEGACLWDPATCRIVPPDPGKVGLSVPARSYTCGPTERFTVTATYNPGGKGGTLADYGATSSSGAVYVESTVKTGANSFDINLYCAAPPGYTDTISAYATDTSDNQSSTSFSVRIQ